MNINPSDYIYDNGDELITITVREFLTLKTASEQGLLLCQNSEFPAVYKKYKGRSVFSPEDTFKQSNEKVSYDSKKITMEMLMAQEIFIKTHLDNIEKGIAKNKNNESEDERS